MAARRRFPLTSLPDEIYPFVCRTLLDSEVFLGLARTCKAIHAIVVSDTFVVALRAMRMPHNTALVGCMLMTHHRRAASDHPELNRYICQRSKIDIAWGRDSLGQSLIDRIARRDTVWPTPHQHAPHRPDATHPLEHCACLRP